MVVVGVVRLLRRPRRHVEVGRVLQVVVLGQRGGRVGRSVGLQLEGRRVLRVCGGRGRRRLLVQERRGGGGGGELGLLRGGQGLGGVQSWGGVAGGEVGVAGMLQEGLGLGQLGLRQLLLLLLLLGGLLLCGGGGGGVLRGGAAVAVLRGGGLLG